MAVDKKAQGLAAKATPANIFSARNGLQLVRKKLAAGQSATVQFWGDSTITGTSSPRRYAAQWADSLAAGGRVPATHGVQLIVWTGSFYAAPAVLRTGTTAAMLTIYVAGVSGSIPRYFMGGYFFKGLASIAADALILAHGINLKAYGSAIAGEYVAAIEQFRSANPNSPILATTQHPNRDDTTVEAARAVLLSYADILGVTVNDEVFQAYLAAGKPTSWYGAGDPIHESEDIGCAVYVAMLNRVWDASAPISVAPQYSRFSTPGNQQQLLLNGDFATWTTAPGVPDDWTGSGTITCARDTSVYADPRKRYSVRMTSAGASQTFISQQVNGLIATQLAGLPVTLAARMKKDTAGNATLGRIELAYTGGSTASVGNVIQQDGFAWSVLSGIVLPSNNTALTVRVYADQTAPPDGTYGIWLDQVSLVPGSMPFAAR